MYALEHLFKHIKTKHKESAQNPMCPICFTTYKNLVVYRKHIIKCHFNSKPVKKKHCAKDEQPIVIEANCVPVQEPIVEIVRDNIENCNHQLNVSNDAFIMQLLTLNINRKTIQQILTSVTHLHTNIYSFLEPIIKEKLSQTDSSSLLQSIRSAIMNFSNTDFRSEHMLLKYLTVKHVYIQPKSYIIGNSFQTRNKGNNNQLMFRSLKGQYISLSETLQSLFSIPGVYKEATNYVYGLKDASKNEFSDYIDGNHWNQLKSKFKDKIVFPLMIHFDDFEAGNPLGSHSTINSIGAVYVSIKSFHPKFLSKLCNIFPVLLFHTLDRTQFRNAKVFRPLIQDLIKLETEGLQIESDNCVEQIYFVLTILLGDNKGLNSILGFTENFTGARCCRFCIANRDQIRNLNIEDDTLLRNVKDYEEHVNNIDVPNTGIKDICVFNDIPSFHLVTNFAVDSMHDILEGVNLYLMARVLRNLIYEKQYFSLEYLNNRVRFFNYGHMGNRNKPATIFKDHITRGYLRMSASESLCFITTFRFYVGHLIPIDNPDYILYLKLLELIKIIFSKSILKLSVEKLPYLISDFIKMYISLYNDMKPKFHFLTHYPRVISESGPPMHFSSLRFESKHSELKKISNNIKTRVNLPRSLAIRYQLKTSDRLLRNIGFQNSDNHSKLFKIPREINRFNVQRYSSDGQDFHVHSIIKIDQNDNWPVYVQIQNIIIDSPTVIFKVNPIQLHNLNKHFDAFEVILIDTSKIEMLTFSEGNIWPQIVHLYKNNLHKYIC
jgi:hypothetical protein